MSSSTQLQQLESKQQSDPALPPGVAPAQPQPQSQAQPGPGPAPAAAQPQGQPNPAAGQQNPPVIVGNRQLFQLAGRQWLRKHGWKIPLVVVAAFTVPSAVVFWIKHS